MGREDTDVVKNVFNGGILNKYAEVMIWALETARKGTGGEYKKGDIILVRYELDSLGLAEIVYRKLLEKGLRVIPRMDITPKMEFDFFDIADDEQLKFLGSWEKILYKNLNGLMGLFAPASLTHLENTDSQKMMTAALSKKPLTKIRDKREESGEFGWTLSMMPTRAQAEKAIMPLEEYAREIIKACYLDKDEPVKEWENLKKAAEAVKSWLNDLTPDISYIHIESINIDLKIGVGEKRKWLGVSGHNIPSFEIFTSPDWRKTEGVYFSNAPSFNTGKYVQGVKLEFKKGEAVEISAVEGDEVVKKMLSMDKGAKRLGELSFTDKHFSPITKFMASTLYDENVGGYDGNCHVAVGAGFLDTIKNDPDAAGKKAKINKKAIGLNESVLHWDLINTEPKRATAILKSGGKVVIYEDGMFKN